MNEKSYSSYEAVVHFSNDEKDVLSNVITVAPIESNSKVVAGRGSCKVCGISSAYGCIKKIKAAFVGSSDFDIHVHDDGDGCVILSW